MYRRCSTTQAESRKGAANGKDTESSTDGDNCAGKNYAPLQYDVKIHSLYPEGNCRASASVNLNGSFAIRGLKVMESVNGLFVSMPSYRTGNGEYKDICFPCTREARSQLNEAVLNAYRQSLAQSQSMGNQGEAAAEHDQADSQMSM